MVEVIKKGEAVFVSTEGKSYQELSADAQVTALKSFIAFYVDQYKRESLEILGAKVDNGLISSINEILDQNSFMGRAELAAESFRLSKPYYEEILTKLPAIKFTDDGEPVKDWQAAWESQEEELPTED